MCVAVGQGPETWVEVRVADFYAQELHAAGGAQAKATLERITRGKRAVCKAQHRSYDRVVAVCRIGGQTVGDLMRSAGVAEGGRAFRPCLQRMAGILQCCHGYVGSSHRVVRLVPCSARCFGTSCPNEAKDTRRDNSLHGARDTR